MADAEIKHLIKRWVWRKKKNGRIIRSGGPRPREPPYRPSIYHIYLSINHKECCNGKTDCSQRIGSSVGRQKNNTILYCICRAATHACGSWGPIRPLFPLMRMLGTIGAAVFRVETVAAVARGMILCCVHMFWAYPGDK
jgi:hypothetical protein